MQAALGAEIEVPTVDGTEKLTIPPETQYGEQFRIRGKGVPYYNHYGSGDLIVQIRIRTPTRLKPEEREILSQFASVRGEQEHPEPENGGSLTSYSTVTMTRMTSTNSLGNGASVILCFVFGPH